MLKALLKLLIANRTGKNPKHQKSTYEEQPRSIFSFKNSGSSLFGSKKYIGPLFEKKPISLPQDLTNNKPDFKVARDSRKEPVVQQTRPLDIDQPHNKNTNTNKDKSGVIGVFIFMFLMIFLGNVAPSLFRGIKFFFVLIFILITSSVIATIFEKK